MKSRISCIVSLLLWIFWIQSHSSLQAENKPQEVEVNVEWIRAIEPELSSSTAKLEGYDRLAYGKGTFLRVEGKSRKSVLLRLDKDDKQVVRLFDLPPFDLKLFSTGRQYYFGGVLTKVERNPAGGIEAIITYANLSEVEGRFYSRQAQEFVARTEESKQKNQAILGKPESQPSQKPAAAPTPVTQPPAVSAPTATPPPAEPKSPPRSDAANPKPKEEPEDPDELPRNRPVLKRRMGEEPEQTARTSPQESPPTGPVSQTTTDDDNVIYRRRDGSRRPVGSSPSSVPSTRPSEHESSDRPVLMRRKPAANEEKKEVDGMMLVPAGSVTLGSDQPGDADGPLNRVELKAFYIDKYEVTNEEYKQFCDATAHTVPPYWTGKGFPSGQEKHPVVQVSWTDALAYARWAGKRLPTEAEWERAAKGPNSYRYAYGNIFDPQKANSGTQKTTPAGSYPPNEFGLFDMTGNVSEWTSSLYMPYPYSDSDGREDPKAAGARTVRGGNHSSNAESARCLVRKKELPDHGSPLLGFRCARDAS